MQQNEEEAEPQQAAPQQVAPQQAAPQHAPQTCRLNPLTREMLAWEGINVAPNSNHHFFKVVKAQPDPLKMILRPNVPNYVTRETEEKIVKDVLLGEIPSSSRPINVSITGMPGIGKTELVLQVLQQVKDKYHYIIWIDCSSIENIEKDIIRIADFLDINIDDVEPLILLQQIYLQTSKFKTLFIFDNIVERDYFLRNILPSNCCITNSNVQFIVTSVHIHWDTDNHVKILPFTDEVANTFLTLALPGIKENSSKSICRIVDNHPFALQLIIKYIKRQNDLRYLNSKVYKPETFIKNNSNLKHLVSLKLATNDRLGYTKSIETLFKDLLNALSHENNNIHALDIIHKICFVNSSNIPVYLFKFEKFAPTIILKESIVLLERYSIITKKDTKISVSPVIQISLALKISIDKRKEILKHLAEYLLDKTEINTKNFQKEIKPDYYQHLVKLWGFIKLSADLIALFPDVPPLLVFSSELSYEDRITHFEKDIDILIKKIGWKNENIINFVSGIIMCHYELKHYKRVLELTKTAMEKIPKEFDKLRPVLKILYYKSLALFKTNDVNNAYIEAKTVYENQKIQSAQNDFDYLFTLGAIFAIVTKMYEKNNDTFMFDIAIGLLRETFLKYPTFMIEKFELLDRLQTCFLQVNKSNDLLELFEEIETFIKASVQTDEVIESYFISKSSFLYKCKQYQFCWSTLEKLLSMYQIQYLSFPSSHDKIEIIINKIIELHGKKITINRNTLGINDILDIES